MEVDHLAFVSMGDVSLSPQLCNGAIELLKFGGFSFKILSLTPIYLSQAENIRVTLSLESRSDGKVGFKTYKNYFVSGDNWFIIIFLILVNIAAQVNKDIYFGFCP